ncbi:MAG: TonB-dependent receptor, partial [Pseudomonadota bacterium]
MGRSDRESVSHDRADERQHHIGHRKERPAIRLAIVSLTLSLLGQPIGLGAHSVAADPLHPVRIAQQGQTRQFDIEAQSLAPALNRFSEQSGISFAYKTGDLSGIQSPGISGNFTTETGLRRLLAGTGITFRFTDPNTVTLESGTARTDGDAMELGPITVEGKSESAIGPVDGYVARRSLTGSKTNTRTIEIPQSISIITRDQLDELGADTLNEALRYTPGFTGEVFGNDSRVDFLQYRGFDENGTGVYRDGLQLRSFGFAEFRPEIYGAQRVEILRGPSSALYGASTPGGVVNVVSKRPPADFFAEAKAEFGNFNYKAGMFDIGGPIAGSEKVQARLTGLVRDSETQIDFIDDDGQFIAPAVTLRPTKDTTFTALGYYQRDRTGASNQFLPADGTLDSNPNGVIPTSRFIGETSFDTFDRDAVAAGYIFEHQFNEIWTVRQNARYDYLDTTYETAFGGGLQADQRTLNRFAFVAEGHSNSVTVDSSVQASFATGPAKHTALVGIDYQYYDVDSLQRFGSAPSIDIFNPVYGAPVPTPPITTDTNIKQNQFGIYAQEQLKLFD